jgi:hypothetical protein
MSRQMRVTSSGNSISGSSIFENWAILVSITSTYQCIESAGVYKEEIDLDRSLVDRFSRESTDGKCEGKWN